MSNWEDKVCLITGACSGIGWSFVQSFAQKGAKCLLVDINHQLGEQRIQELIGKYGLGRFEYMKADVTSHQNFEGAFEKCLELFGRIDVLVNSAGILSEINWETELQINLHVSVYFLIVLIICNKPSKKLCKPKSTYAN